MSSTVLELCDRIRALSVEEKYEVLRILQTEADEQKEAFPEALAELLEQRQREVESGEMAVYDLDKSFARIRARRS